jgi:hypothetical protein
MKPARSDPPDRAALHGLLRLDPRIVFECAHCQVEITVRIG